MARDQVNSLKDGWARPSLRTFQPYFSGRRLYTVVDTIMAVLVLTCLSDYFLVSVFSMYLVELRYTLTTYHRRLRAL